MKNKLPKVNVNSGCLLYDDYIKVRNKKKGDTVVLSNGVEYEVEDNKIDFPYDGNRVMDMIAYGSNDV